jgi:hypothetical protein
MSFVLSSPQQAKNCSQIALLQTVLVESGFVVMFFAAVKLCGYLNVPFPPVNTRKQEAA